MRIYKLAGTLVLGTLASWAQAQQPGLSAAGSEQWTFEISPYLWAVGLNGDMTVKGQDAKVDEDFGDILSNLNMAGEVHFEAWKGRWGMFVDATYIDLKSDAQSGPVDIDAEVKMWLVDFAGLYQVSTWQLGEASENRRGGLELLVGGRYTDMEPKLDFKDSPLPTVKQKASWTDLILGARLTADLSAKWSMVLRADVGGFGIGSSSDLTASGSALFDWRFKPQWDLLMGYRALYQDYDKGSGDSKFAYDVTTHGPIVGVKYQF